MAFHYVTSCHNAGWQYQGHLDRTVYQFSLMHRFVRPLMFFDSSKWKEKTKTVNGTAILIVVKIGSYVQLCTFFKTPLHCPIPALTAEWQSLYGPFSPYSCCVVLMFLTNIFKLLLCDLLKYQATKYFLKLRYQNTAVYYRCI